MSELPNIIEPTTVLRDWLRTQGITGTNVWAGGLASPDSPDLPALVVTRAGGQLRVPLDLPAFQFDCWAATASEAATIAGSLVTLLLQTRPRTVLGTVDAYEIRWGGVIEETITILPTPITDPRYHRYIVTAQITTIAVPA